MSVCVLRGSSEDTESLQAHLNKRACEAELTTDNSKSDRQRERERGEESSAEEEEEKD